jgi:hypothetical protein
MNSQSRIAGVIRITACTFLALIILAYAGLISLGRWQLDEYSEFYRMRVAPLDLFGRLRWSPRPISEPLFWMYGWAVNQFHHRLIAPFLGLLWLILLAATLYTPVQRLSERSRRVWPGLLVSLTLVALAVSGGDATEVFYWPAGSVAYIPTLAATLLLFLQTVDGRLNTKQGCILAAVCLIIAAGSSEAGATFVFCYGLIQIFQRIVETWRNRTTANRRPLAWCVVPFTLAGAVLVIVRTNRFHATELAVTHPALGHPIRSLIEGAKEMVIEIIGRNMLANTYHQYPDPHLWFHSGLRLPFEMLVGSHLWMELLLVISVAFLWSTVERPAKQTVRQILEVCTAFLGAALLTIAAANLHFGVTCCERHELLRESWWNMILVGLAIGGTAWISDMLRQRLARFTSLATLMLPLAVLSLSFTGPLSRTYRNYALLRKATVQNEESSFQKDKDSMLFLVLPEVGVITEEPVPTGTYTNPAETTEFNIDMYPYYLLRYFEKRTVVIQPLAIPGEPGLSQKK